MPTTSSQLAPMLVPNLVLSALPSLNISFTEEELAAVCAAANDHVSLRDVAHRAVLAAASEHKRRVGEAARIVAERFAELNRRLA